MELFDLIYAVILNVSLGILLEMYKQFDFKDYLSRQFTGEIRGINFYDLRVQYTNFIEIKNLHPSAYEETTKEIPKNIRYEITNTLSACTMTLKYLNWSSHIKRREYLLFF